MMYTLLKETKGGSPMRKVLDVLGNVLPLRVWQRKGTRVQQNPSIRVKCGCCDESVVIYFGNATGNPQEDTLEINGVHGSVQQWRDILLPLLQQPQV